MTISIESIQELIGNICGKKHNSFRKDCVLAQRSGVKLYVLVKNTDGIKSIDDVFCWGNPRLNIFVSDKTSVVGYYKSGNPRYERIQKYPKATSGSQLANAMLNIQMRYGVQFVFCKPSESEAKIMELSENTEK